MKPRRPFPNERTRWYWASIFGACAAASTLSAADTNAPPAAAPTAPAAPAAPPALSPAQMFEGGTNSYSNWLDLSTGGFLTGGNRAQFEQQHQSWPGPFGGIEDFHYQGNVDKSTTLTMDGHALFDEHDYKLSLELVRPDTGFVRFNYTQFRTWYNGDGGFFPPAGTWYPLGADALALDRGEISLEGGLTLKNLPKITFKYTHTYREGDEGSTSWGPTHPAGDATVRGLGPSFYTINEYSDSFQVDVTHHIKATDLGLGLRYETGKLDDALNISQWLTEPAQQSITDRQGTTYDLFNIHAFTETWLSKKVMFSTGYSFTDLDNNFTGSQIYGSDFGVGYVPSAQSGFGYYGLSGYSRLQQYVMDVNLMAKPLETLSIVPSLRVQKEDTDADAGGMETLGLYPATAFSGLSALEDLDVRERMDVNYTGVTNWVFNARGEWTEGQGNVAANGGLLPVNGIGIPPIQQGTDESRFFQKYSIGARWYPVRRVTLDFGGYYKANDYNYNNFLDSTLNNSANRYPGYLVMQNFDTYDGNVGLTLRLRPNLTLVSRYEYQWSTIYTEPDPTSGLSGLESSQMQSQIIAQNLSWSPWPRLYLQPGFNYVLSKTKTPASDYTQAILAAQNNYWTLNFNAGLVVDDKTDLNLGYFYYRADDYQNNATFGVPYGAGGEEHGVTASIVRRLTQNLRLTVKYGFYSYTDALYGGHDNYQAHFLLSSLQYRF